MRLLLLGASGYVGEAFRREIEGRGWSGVFPRRAEVDYTTLPGILELLDRERFDGVVNAAGYTGKPNVDACESARADTLIGNVMFPQMVGQVCRERGIPFGQVSSGCIYTGGKLVEGGRVEVRKNLMEPEVLARIERDRSIVRGFTEEDEPNFSFRDPPCSFYSGSKALGEEGILRLVGEDDGWPYYIWRLRIPFDEFDGARNYLSKVLRYPKVYVNLNSISNRADFVRACLDLLERRAASGIYNITNPGWVSTRDVVDLLRRTIAPDRDFEFWEDDEEFYRMAAATPRSNCIMDVTKLLEAGVRMRPVDEALADAVERWVWEGHHGGARRATERVDGSGAVGEGRRVS